MRGRIYELFCAYEQMKGQWGDWDVSDLVSGLRASGSECQWRAAAYGINACAPQVLHIHKQLQARPFPEASKFHYCYVDEVTEPAGCLAGSLPAHVP